MEDKNNTPTDFNLVGKRKSFLHKIQVDNFQSSTKLEGLMQVSIYQSIYLFIFILFNIIFYDQFIYNRNYIMKLQDYGAKGIVFSQFVNFLDVFSWFFLQRYFYFIVNLCLF